MSDPNSEAIDHQFEKLQKTKQNKWAAVSSLTMLAKCKYKNGLVFWVINLLLSYCFVNQITYYSWNKKLLQNTSNQKNLRLRYDIEMLVANLFYEDFSIAVQITIIFFAAQIKQV